MNEKQWQQMVLNLAHMRGFRSYHTFDSRRCTPGFPDLVLVRAPRVLFVELKTDAKTSRLSPAQREWLADLGECPGVESFVWRPADLDDVQRILAPACLHQ